MQSELVARYHGGLRIARGSQEPCLGYPES